MSMARWPAGALKTGGSRPRLSWRPNSLIPQFRRSSQRASGLFQPHDGARRGPGLLETVLDLKPGYRPAFSFPGYWLYAAGEPIVHLIPGRGGPVDRGGETIDHVAFRLADHDGMRVRLEALAIPYSRMELPELGERRLFVRTPTGILLELVFREAKARSSRLACSMQVFRRLRSRRERIARGLSAGRSSSHSGSTWRAIIILRKPFPSTLELRLSGMSAAAPNRPRYPTTRNSMVSATSPGPNPIAHPVPLLGAERINAKNEHDGRGRHVAIAAQDVSRRRKRCWREIECAFDRVEHCMARDHLRGGRPARPFGFPADAATRPSRSLPGQRQRRSNASLANKFGEYQACFYGFPEAYIVCKQQRRAGHAHSAREWNELKVVPSRGSGIPLPKAGRR